MSINVKTSYSFNGSIITEEALVKDAIKKGYKYIGIVDNSLACAYKFYKYAISNNIKPIIGLEAEVASLFSETINNLLLIYAKNFSGYKELIEISTIINLEKRPLNLSELAKYNNLLFVFDSSYGYIYEMAKNRDIIEFNKMLDGYKKILDNIYIGVNVNSIFYEYELLPFFANFDNAIITNSVNYLNRGEYIYTNILKCIIENKQFVKESLFEIEESKEYLFDYNEYINRFASYPNLLSNTDNFIQLIDLKLDYSNKYLPKFETGLDVPNNVYLRKLCETGLKRRLELSSKKNLYKKYKERLDHELEIIDSMGYNDYFLIVWDFILYAKRNNVLVGPGRGSAAGSLVSYVLGIIDIDPIEYDLYFERFLNPERITLPDIDNDFPDDKRDFVINYVKEKYGENQVVAVSTFNSFQTKSAIRDISRILNVKEYKLNELLDKFKDVDSIKEFLDKNKGLYDYYARDEEFKLILDTALHIDKLPRHIGTHASAIIFSPDSILNYTPVLKTQASPLNQTVMEASDLESIGLLKIDFLAIKNLSIIERILKLVKDNYNVDINLNNIPMNDSKTYKMLREKSTLGIFQLESEGMQKFIKNLQVKEFSDIYLALALYRPGPMDNIPLYLDRRFKRKKVEYPDSSISDILKDTLGIIVYQEQIMAILNRYAGFSLGKADVVRRAMSKKKLELMINEKKEFIDGAVKNGKNPNDAGKLYDEIVKFADYGFNKSHSVGYAKVSYWMAYLKANFPAEFMISLLSNVVNIEKYLYEIRNLGLNIHLPDVNKSGESYTNYGKDIYMPLTVINNIGRASNMDILSSRDKPFKDYKDFVNRVSRIAGKSNIESLIFASSLDSFNLSKRTMIENLDSLMKKDLTKYVSGFEEQLIEYDEYDFDFLMSKEKEVLGFNFKYHPLKRFIKLDSLYPSDLNDDYLNKTVNIIAYVSSIKKTRTKSGKNIMFMTIGDEVTQISAVIFDSFIKPEYLGFENKNCYKITGILNKNKDIYEIQVNSMIKL